MTFKQRAFLSTSSKLIEELELTKWPKVRMRNPKLVIDKLETMARAGPSKLLILSDFDFTLSRHRKNGEQCIITHQLVADLGAIRDPEGYKQILADSKKYEPFELCQKMSVQEKMQHMENWWNNTHNFIVKQQFTESFLREAVKKSRVHLRDQCSEFLELLNHHGVPIIVFSAGIANIIQFVFQQQIHNSSANLNNVQIIGNQMQFDSEGICVGFADPLIHTFNKNATVLSKNLRNKFDESCAILLIGDSLGDVNMDVGIGQDPGKILVLKVGFLNFNEDKLLDKYMDGYDIVLVDDETMEVPMRIAKHVTGT